MKMGSGLFWGILIILIGLSILLKGLNIHFPIFKLVFGIFFIYLGIRLVTGGFGKNTFHGGNNEVIFGEKDFTTKGEQNEEFNVIFGKGVFDFTKEELKETPQQVKINTVFGDTELKFKKGTPYRVTASTAFGAAKLPNGNATALGTTHYETEELNKDSAYYNIKTDVVFGNLEVVEEE